jgi:hypothetical protein
MSVERIRFLRFKGISEPLLHNLVCTLNAEQEAFEFDLGPEEVEVPADAESPSGYDVPRLESATFAAAVERYPGEYPVGVCDLPLKDELSTSFDGRVALVSIAGWREQYAPFPVSQILAFNMVDILLSRRISTPVHEETRGCPMDYCDDRADRLAGLRKCEVCPDCRTQILKAIRAGEVPFGGTFDELYKTCLRPTVESHGWICCRADEVYQPREIIDLIWEEIHRADLVIADLTGRNPNVFYEVGYAHALLRPTVLLVQDIKEVPFDLRHRQLLRYEPDEEGMNDLAAELRRYLVEI